MPGENLFPASLLSSAPVRGTGGEQLGQCAEAMIGCGSGRIRYLVIGTGGLAGAGESFRRIEWDDASVNDGAVDVRLHDVETLPELAKDDWPGR